MKKKVTSTDIARAAGVSQSTVSMILNKKYDVSFAKETVEKVENAAKEPIRPAEKENEEGDKKRETSGCVLPQSDESVLCYAAAGNRGACKRKRIWSFCM